jgi:hypothetical protein
MVIDGELRLAAARQLGLASVPCIRVDHLNESEQRLLRLAVNRLGEKGSWDIAELEAEFKELIIAEAPIELSGFGSDEIDQILIGSEDENAEVGDLEPSAGASSVSRINDLFRLGPHRLICGNATDPRIVSRLMQSNVARLIFTDEPFNVAIGGHVTGGDHREFVMASGEMSGAQFLEFNRNWIGALRRLQIAHIGDRCRAEVRRRREAPAHHRQLARAVHLFSTDYTISMFEFDWI